jgi:hypothetical protein
MFELKFSKVRINGLHIAQAKKINSQTNITICLKAQLGSLVDFIRVGLFKRVQFEFDAHEVKRKN